MREAKSLSMIQGQPGHGTSPEGQPPERARLSMIGGVNSGEQFNFIKNI
jgi:hypothetical protein